MDFGPVLYSFRHYIKCGAVSPARARGFGEFHTTLEISFKSLSQEMVNGHLGENGRVAIRHVELVLSTEKDTATVLGLFMVENLVQETTPII